MSLSMLEVMTILQPMKQNFSRLDLPSLTSATDGDSEGPMQSFLDNLTSLIVEATPAALPKEVCAASLSVLSSECCVNIALSDVHIPETSVRQLVHSIWDWMTEASRLLDETFEHNAALLWLVMRWSLGRIRRLMKERGGFVIPLTEMILAKKRDLSEPEEMFLLISKATHIQLLEHFGDNAVLDSSIGADAMFAWAKEYREATSKFDGFAWLDEFQRQMLPSGELAPTDRNPNAPSLLQYMEELFTPFAQFEIIRKAARKPFVRNVLHRSLQVTVLSVPHLGLSLHSAFHSMDNFDNRVEAYLAAAYESFSLRGAANEFKAEAIQLYLGRVQQGKAEGRLPGLVAPHPACTLLRYHLDSSPGDVASSRTPYPYMGVSEPPSFPTALYFEAYNVCGLGPLLRTNPSNMKLFPCFVPNLERDQHNRADQAIEKEMAIRLKVIIGHLLSQMTVDLREDSLLSVYRASVQTTEVLFDTEKYRAELKKRLNRTS
ncbi:hypothetical protein MSAN_02310500 [Mycena sanguinolenta]|uniref:Uncharacterized protein n=1 Tax=Mycena sanguinolenta TaxID=230812 RepID=A0A8H6X7G3_9AGAR|nr:hypothetical protein MSAN_02310500 [Mycena sanguinolenta]